jgi:hypothetical protein
MTGLDWTRLVSIGVNATISVKPLNAKLNPICHLLALLGAHHILHVSRIRVNGDVKLNKKSRSQVGFRFCWSCGLVYRRYTLLHCINQHLSIRVTVIIPSACTGRSFPRLWSLPTPLAKHIKFNARSVVGGMRSASVLGNLYTPKFNISLCPQCKRSEVYRWKAAMQDTVKVYTEFSILWCLDRIPSLIAVFLVMSNLESGRVA